MRGGKLNGYIILPFIAFFQSSMAKSQSFKCGNEQSNRNYEMCNDFKQSLKLIEKHKLGSIK